VVGSITVTVESYNLDGLGERDHETYYVRSMGEHDYWPAVTDIPCPVEGCTHTVVWSEAGYVPGYRVCMASLGTGQDGLERFDMDTIRHRFQARGNAAQPTLVLLDAEEDE
jgi:hypothetical protein